jgi:hypothetical protein
MELFNTILCRILYPLNTNEELRGAYAPIAKPYVGLFTAATKYNDAIIIYKNPKYKDFLFYLANNLLFYNTPPPIPPTTEHTIYDVVSFKYEFLKKNIHTFMVIVNNDFIDLFRDVQKHYMAFAKFANIWKHKRLPLQIDHDLYMTPLNRTNRNVFSLLQQGKIYLFTGPNLVNIICTALSNAPNFFIEPLVIKNPYNNIPLSKSDLYNMYFFLKQSPIIMPILFHNYFLVDFDLRKFCDENENVIKNIAFKSYVRNASATTLYSSAIQMLKKYKKEIVIHKDFPKDTIINILRPYLLLYYVIEYSSEEYRIGDTEYLLKYKLKRLYHHNPAFGRKIVKLKRVGFSKKMIKTIEFCSKHPDFDEPMDMATYQKTHLEMVDANYLSSEESEEEGVSNNEDDDDDETNAPFVIISPHPSFAISHTTFTVLSVDLSNANVVREEGEESDSDEDEDGHNTESVVDPDSDNEIVIEGESDSGEDESAEDDTW